jgi:hypothetical protein
VSFDSSQRHAGFQEILAARRLATRNIRSGKSTFRSTAINAA